MADSELGLKGKGVEKQTLKELDDAMAELLKHRKDRMESGKKEKQALLSCIRIWNENKLRAYEYADRNYVLKESQKIVVEDPDDDDGE